MSTKDTTSSENRLQRVTEAEKKGWPSIAVIWAGIMICVPALMGGGLVSAGLPVGGSILAMFLGFFIVLLFMVPLGVIGTDLGLPTVTSISRAFGERGSRLVISILLTITNVAWFGVQASVCGSSFSNIVHELMGVNIPPLISSIFWGMVMLLTAVFGIEMIRYLNFVAVPALIIGLVYGVYSSLSTPGAFEALQSYQPATPFSLMTGINLTIAIFVVASATCCDYTRFCKSRKDTLLACSVGVLPSGVVVLSIGACLAIIAGTSDLTLVLANTGIPALGPLVLILATWTTNTSCAYTSGISVVNIFGLHEKKRGMATFIVGIIGIILAILGITNHFMSFLGILNNLIPPVIGVALCDYWVICKGKKENWAPTEGFNFIGIASWLCGALGSFLLGEFFMSSINAILISFVAYLVLTKLAGKKQAENKVAEAQ